MTECHASLPLSPHLRDMAPYPFARLEHLRQETEAKGIRVIDLSIGDLREPTPETVKEALISAIPERSSYPRALGLPELRTAVAAWLGRRFGVEADPDRHVLPSNGSKEVVFNLPLAVVDREHRPVVLLPDPAYPVYARGAEAAGAIIHRMPLKASHGFLPDLDAVPAEVWDRAAILWVNYPNNPTGAMAPLAFFREAAARCREHGVLLASDEAYTELFYGDVPAGALEAGFENVVVLHTLSKRSALPGYRSGFLAGDPRLIAALKRFRPAVGVATPRFIQRAAIAAWEDEAHVRALRGLFGERRAVMAEGLAALGLEVTGAPATIYLWVRTPPGESSESFTLRALEAGVLVVPGSAMGSEGEGYFRLSLTAPPEIVREVLARLGRVVGGGA